jgi:hypothetical protein
MVSLSELVPAHHVVNDLMALNSVFYVLMIER